MKFCERREYNYTKNNIEASAHYVTYEDVLKFHGKEFAVKWKEFIEDKPFLKEGWYYYENYKFAARQTDSYLNPIS